MSPTWLGTILSTYHEVSPQPFACWPAPRRGRPRARTVSQLCGQVSARRDGPTSRYTDPARVLAGPDSLSVRADGAGTRGPPRTGTWGIRGPGAAPAGSLTARAAPHRLVFFLKIVQEYFYKFLCARTFGRAHARQSRRPISLLE